MTSRVSAIRKGNPNWLKFLWLLLDILVWTYGLDKTEVIGRHSPLVALPKTINAILFPNIAYIGCVFKRLKTLYGQDDCIFTEL